MTNYDFSDKKIERLVKISVSHQWDIFRELDWDVKVNPESLASPGTFSLMENLPEFKKLSERQKQEVKYKEVAYHLSNLLGGEHTAILLGAQILVEGPQDTPDWSYFVSNLLNDERNHAQALSKYLKEKIGACYQPHPRMKKVLQDLSTNAHFTSKLFIGQVVLEWTAASLLTSMMMRNPEPLAGQICRRILNDEGRHLGFSKLVAEQFSPGKSGILPRSFEDLLFESIAACISSLCAIPVWKEYGFSRSSCMEYALAEMESKGVLKFYREVLPRELKKYHLFSSRLETLVSNELIQRVMNDHLSYEPLTLQENQYAAAA